MVDAGVLEAEATAFDVKEVEGSAGGCNASRMRGSVARYRGWTSAEDVFADITVTELSEESFISTSVSVAPLLCDISVRCSSIHCIAAAVMRSTSSDG